LNFDFYNPTRILFGKDRLEGIDKYVPANATVLITFGGGIAKKSGIIGKVKTVLGKRNIKLYFFHENYSHERRLGNLKKIFAQKLGTESNGSRCPVSKT